VSAVVPAIVYYAASLVVSANIVLQLFAAYDQDGNLTGHRIRYIRTGPFGGIVTDVLLSPVQHQPS
jgi:hypothetical protein